MAQGGTIPERLDPGLYLVATPIGAARDITLRALDILSAADVIAAEDTRTARKLMDIHGIPVGGRPLIAYHEHSRPERRGALISHLREGKSVAYVSEAGTPLVSDPGYALVRDAIAGEIVVRAAPGASSVLAALCVSGLPSDRFFFAGFLPTKSGARRKALAELRDVPGTIIFFEAARRCSESLREILSVMGDREVALCRELTKRFEEIRRGRVSELLEAGLGDVKGEVVLVIDRAGKEADDLDIDGALREALSTLSVRDAANAVSEAHGLRKREVYQIALKIAGEDSDGSDAK